MNATTWSALALLITLSTAIGLRHVWADDRVRAELRECRAHDEVDALCWETVQGANEVLRAMACQCWIPGETP